MKNPHADEMKLGNGFLRLCSAPIAGRSVSPEEVAGALPDEVLGAEAMRRGYRLWMYRISIDEGQP